MFGIYVRGGAPWGSRQVKLCLYLTCLVSSILLLVAVIKIGDEASMDMPSSDVFPRSLGDGTQTQNLHNFNDYAHVHHTALSRHQRVFNNPVASTMALSDATKASSEIRLVGSSAILGYSPQPSRFYKVDTKPKKPSKTTITSLDFTSISRVPHDASKTSFGMSNEINQTPKKYLVSAHRTPGTTQRTHNTNRATTSSETVFVSSTKSSNNASRDYTVGSSRAKQIIPSISKSESGINKKKILPDCPFWPPGLQGKLDVLENVKVSTVERREATSGGGGGQVCEGGRWWPRECQARWSVAILVPYRDRSYQIAAFLNHMHPYLQRQQVHYRVYFIEQHGTEPFNRARLLNVGFLEAEKDGPWDCYAFHDIDMLPENDHNLYHCPLQPRHLVVRSSQRGYRDASIDQYFGGAALMTRTQIWTLNGWSNEYWGGHVETHKSHVGGVCLMMGGDFRRVNGWSNQYWGWGAEDNDLYHRVLAAGMTVLRYPGKMKVGDYRMLGHKPEPKNKNRFKTLKDSTDRMYLDGLSNLNYTLLTKTNLPLHTHIMVDIGHSPLHLTITAAKP